MATCIYCGVEESGISDEHILQESLGSNWKSKNILCQTCNNLFGRTIDDVLANEMIFFRNYLSIMGKDDVIPKVELKTASGEIFTRDGYTGDYVLKDRPDINRNIDDEGTLLSINAKTQVAKTDKIIKDIEKGLARKGYAAGSMSAHGYTAESIGNTPVEIRISLPSYVALRKSLINYWAMILGKNESSSLRSEANKVYKFAKFIENKDVTTEEFVKYAKELGINGYPLPLTISKETKDKLTKNNPVAHTLVLLSENGKLLGGISLFGSIQWGFMFQEKYDKDGLWITTINPLKKERIIKSNESINAKNNDFTFHSVPIKKYFEIFVEQLSEAMQHCLAMEHLTSIKGIIEPRDLEKYFPINDIDSIKNIFLERAALIFGYVFSKYGVTPHIFRTEIGIPFVHEAVSSCMNNLNIKELNANSYNIFISGCFKIGESMANSMPFLVTFLQAETDKILSSLYAKESTN